MKDTKLPLLEMKDITLFPKMLVKFVGVKEETKRIIKYAIKANSEIFVVPNNQKGNIEYGTVSEIKEYHNDDNGQFVVLLKGKSRGLVKNIDDNGEFRFVNIKQFEDKTNEKRDIYLNIISILLDKYLESNNELSSQIKENIQTINETGKIIDTVAVNLPISNEQKNNILGECLVEDRFRAITDILKNEIKDSEFDKEINNKAKKNVAEQERRFWLEKKLDAINKELGISKEKQDYQAEEYEKKLKRYDYDEFIYNKIKFEIGKLRKNKDNQYERGLIINYLEVLFNLPINKSEEKDIDDINKKLNISHYGFIDLKDKIIEHMTIKKYLNKKEGMILCLVGPPGIGKTSIAQSIANSIGKKYSTISLGGMKDEAELKGHRRTYVGAMPGKIIKSFIDTEMKDPVIIFDEIDKVSNQVKGDPYSVLLEVFDYKQNDNFKDYYLDFGYDISEVIYICTANSIDNIPSALLDRMDIVYLESYTDYEKLMIAKEYIIPKLMKEYKLSKDMVNISKAAIEKIITDYTKEAGVRELERKLSQIFRRVIRNIFTTAKKSDKITVNNLIKYLGECTSKKVNIDTKIGEVIGLAWTSVGGRIIRVQADSFAGQGQFRFTGKIGSIMQESSMLVYTYIRINAEKLGVDKDFYKNKDIHIHIPEGAIPKDGPSAGITVMCALVSSLINKPLKKGIAMTGEITIKGDILPVGGIKEKVLAAIKCGIKKVILPLENKKDVTKLIKETNNKIEYIFVSQIDEVFDIIFD